MNNISVIASPELLLLFGLFLITCPAEGFVAGWSDWSDQEMAKSTGRKQNELTFDEQQKDGEVLFKPNNIDGPLTGPDYTLNDRPEQDAKEVQNNETSSTGEDVSNDQQNNVNHGSKVDDAVVFFLPMPRRL